MTLTRALARIVRYLRAGYPTGIPATDYIPLLALLKRRLTDSEIITITTELTQHGHLSVDVTDIRVAITKITDDLPDADDIGRVRAHLATIGWSIADEFTPPET
ncbi:DUF3349 domain-containing protein [Mycobacteroides stephanolepidis]|nr:DUF3349 domain-containing protein [[Mycobacterium] stephanolepidis]